MATITAISWTDHTFNPWIGCTKIDALCGHCYAERDDLRRKWTPEGWGKGKPRRRTGFGNWQLPYKWNAEALAAGVRHRVFCASLADWLDDEVPIEWLADLLRVIRDNKALDWQLLTKRPRIWSDRLHQVVRELHDGIDEFASQWLDGDAPSNVWIGTSVGNQESSNARLLPLFEIPARIRFLSCEPLLGPVDLNAIMDPRGIHFSAIEKGALVPERIDWLICGGESGPHARPMHPAWTRQLRDDCHRAGIPFFFKQWGEWCPASQISAIADPLHDHRFDDGIRSFRIGKNRAGHLLDGRVHQSFPPPCSSVPSV